jgi:hypothetical protein
MCAQELRELRDMRRLFIETGIPAIAADAMQRLHDGVLIVREQGVLRIARVLTAAAACILVAGCGWLLYLRQPGPTSIAAWEGSAIMLDAAPTRQSELRAADLIPIDVSMGVTDE